MAQWSPSIRAAFRSLIRRPATSTLAAATFGLGIAACAAMFSVVNAVLLRPLPFPAPEQIMSVFPTIPEWRRDEGLSRYADRGSFSYEEFLEWQEKQTSFTAVAGVARRWQVVAAGGAAHQVPVGRATPGLFLMLGVVPAAGRVLAPEDNESEGRGVMVSHRFWRSELGGDPGAIGRTVRLSDVPYRVVGILPQDFRLDGYDVDVWTAIGGPPERVAASGLMLAGDWLTGLGRLRPDIGPGRAANELATILRALATPDHVEHGGRVVSRVSDVTRSVRGPLHLLFAASMLLLLVACASTSAVALSVATDREGEMVVRSALGAGRGRLASQLLAESLLLAAAGAVVGLLCAVPLTRALIALAPAGLPRIDDVAFDWNVLAFAFVVTAVSGVLFGLAPALHVSRTDLYRRMGGVRTLSRRASGQRALVITELALAMVLLVGAGLLARTMVALGRVDVGFDRDRVLALEVAPFYNRFYFAGDTTTAERQPFEPYAERLLAGLRSLPDIEVVAMASPMPYSGNTASNPVEPDGYTPAPDESMDVERRLVSPEYFDAMGIPIVAGRGFMPQEDRADAAHVVVISQRLAESYWPGQDPVGRVLGYWDRRATVVGVAGDVRDADLTSRPNTIFYMPYHQASAGLGTVVLRTRGVATAAIPTIRQRVRETDADLAIVGITPVADMMAGTIAQQRFRARLIGAFAVAAAILAVMGVYGVISRSVARRTREMGIRMALGAERRSVVGLVVSESLRLALSGLAIGALIALGAARLLESFLFGVARNDAATFLVIALGLCTMAVAASIVPARQATKVDPTRALRSD